MPLHIPVFVNDREIGAIHIGRLDNRNLENVESTYVVTVKEYPQIQFEGKTRKWTPNWDSDVEFTHTYADGALVCLRKAIEALEKAGVTDFD